MMPIDKRDPEEVSYHIITKKDKAQFKLPENVIQYNFLTSIFIHKLCPN